MKNLNNLPEVCCADRWIVDEHNNGHMVCELDEDLINWNKVRFIMEGHSESGCTYHLVRYTCSDGVNRLCAIYCMSDITAKDFTEWCASSCGMTYNAYVGKPWLD